MVFRAGPNAFRAFALPRTRRAVLQGASRLSSPRFKALYRVWKEVGEAAFASCTSDALDNAVKVGAGRVETLELGHRYGHLSPLVAVA